jgi:putative ABC transport system substrate-binding protein
MTARVRLMAYGSTVQPWARAAVYVDKILRGAKPADLPVEESSSFSVVINAKTARTLGLSIPAALRLQATEVIE